MAVNPATMAIIRESKVLLGDLLMFLSHLVVVQGVAIQAAWGPHFLPPEVGVILGQPGLSHLGSVGRGPILLEDLGTHPDNFFHPRLDHIPHDIDACALVHPHVGSQPHHGPPQVPVDPPLQLIGKFLVHPIYKVPAALVLVSRSPIPLATFPSTALFAWNHFLMP